MKWLIIGLAIAISGVIAIQLLHSNVPIVIDDAALLDGAERDIIGTYHAHLLRDLDIDYRVVTTTSEEPILEESVDTFRRLKIGSRSSWPKGLLLVINPATDQVRLEVGYSLESVFPDAFVGYVERNQMVPFFADGRVADGILATTELIVDRAQRNELSSEEIWMEGSGGGGAQTAARIGAGRDTTQAPHARNSHPADSPEQALQLYLHAMERRDTSPDLPIYSSSSKAMLRESTVTPAQMDGIVRIYRDCTPEPIRYSASANFAVIRYSPGARQCAPWFFVKSGSDWTIDLAAMRRAIGFGRTNAWHVSSKGFGDYAFGFDDWGFDEKGFPR